jgi:hypothetical protein
MDEKKQQKRKHSEQKTVSSLPTVPIVTIKRDRRKNKRGVNTPAQSLGLSKEGQSVTL